MAFINIIMKQDEHSCMKIGLALEDGCRMCSDVEAGDPRGLLTNGASNSYSDTKIFQALRETLGCVCGPLCRI